MPLWLGRFALPRSSADPRSFAIGNPDQPGDADKGKQPEENHDQNGVTPAKNAVMIIKRM